jgi:hypothetical protein
MRTDGEGDEALAPARPAEGLTMDELAREVERCRRRWKQDRAARDFVAAVLDGLKSGGGEEEGGGGIEVDKGVALGMGSFSSEKGDRMRSLWQLVAFVEVGDACTYCCRVEINIFTVLHMAMEDKRVVL